MSLAHIAHFIAKIFASSHYIYTIETDVAPHHKETVIEQNLKLGWEYDSIKQHGENIDIVFRRKK